MESYEIVGSAIITRMACLNIRTGFSTKMISRELFQSTVKKVFNLLNH